MKMNSYSEDSLVEQPAINLFNGLGWEAANCFNEFDGGKSTLGREAKSEVILTARLRPALQRLNPDATPEAIHQAIEEMTRDLLLPRLISGEVDVSELDIAIPEEAVA